MCAWLSGTSPLHDRSKSASVMSFQIAGLKGHAALKSDACMWEDHSELSQPYPVAAGALGVCVEFAERCNHSTATKQHVRQGVV